MRPDRTFALLLLCFFLSGLAGLVYETAWTRQFAVVFGTSSLAIATVLAAYMAGLAAGAALAARFAHRIRRPVLAYGLLELGIALAALAMPLAIGASRGLYVWLYGGQPDLPASGGMLPAIFYTVCSFAILMVPTAMMGATLPLLARHAVRREREIAGRVGVLYAMNTAGAVAGTLVAAFVLLPSFGLRQTIWIAAGINALVFAAAGALARSADDAPLPPGREAARPSGGRWVLPLIAASGMASFAYEVMWVRLLEHVLNTSVHAFASMLASFLTGIALGAAVASRFGSTPRRATAGFAIAQVATAALSWIAFLGVDRIPDLVTLLYGLEIDRSLMHVALAMLVLFPPALFIGATFPFAVRILARDEHEAGSASARVYTANTLGSIVGSLGASFVAIPWLGFAGTLSACAALNVALAGAATLHLGLPRRAVVAATVAAMATLAVVRPPPPWKLMSVGVSYAKDSEPEVVFFEAGRTSTVLLARSSVRWMLTTNGLIEAGIDPPGAMHNSAERWMAALPVLARPELESMLLIGLGGGVMLESVPESVRRIDVIELEPEVVAANRAIADRRWRDPLADPRLALYVNDARNALLLSERRFDAIVSQPSHPWIGGAAHLFTREFFELAHSRLGDDGVFVQWMGLSYLDDALMRSLIATLHAVFAHVRVYCPPPCTDAVFVASNHELPIERTAARALATGGGRYAEIGITRPEDTTAWLLFDEATARRMSRGATVNRDDRNWIQSESSKVDERALRGRIDETYAADDPLSRWTRSSIEPLFVIEAASRRRAQRLAGLGPATYRMSALSPSDRVVARGLAQIPGAVDEQVLRELGGLLEREPRHRFGRAVMLRLSSDALSQGADPATRIAPPLDAAESAVALAWGALGSDARADWPALDADLDAVGVGHPLYRDAQRLRARWRIDSGDPTLAREALPIIDRVLLFEPGDLLLRTRACLAADEGLAAFDSMISAVELLANPAVTYPGRIREARRMLAQMRAVPRQQGLAEELDRSLEAARNEQRFRELRAGGSR